MSLKGKIDGDDFVIKRAVHRKGKSILEFNRNGVKMERFDIRKTQELIDEALGTDILCQTVFFTHGNISHLLGV